MKKYYLAVLFLIILIIFLLSFIFLRRRPHYENLTNNTFRFNNTGSIQEWTVPENIHHISFKIVGGGGGSFITNSNISGGKAAVITGFAPVTPGQKLYICAGGQGGTFVINEVYVDSLKKYVFFVSDISSQKGGYNGGGNGQGPGAGGGGASHIATSNGLLKDLNKEDLIAVAGGGGGAGRLLEGGSGGIPFGGNGYYISSYYYNNEISNDRSNKYYASSVGGGTMIEGGGISSKYGKRGSFGQGANATCKDNDCGIYDYPNPQIGQTSKYIASNESKAVGGAGGGGGGLYGGASGSTVNFGEKNSPIYFSGGGGSSYVNNTVLNQKLSNNNTIENGYVEIYTDARYGPGLGRQITLFNYTGADQEWTVPDGVNQVEITVIGPDGGYSSPAIGGKGGKISATMDVQPGQKYNIIVGGRGQNKNYSIKQGQQIFYPEYPIGESQSINNNSRGSISGSNLGEISNPGSGGAYTGIKLNNSWQLIAGGGGGAIAYNNYNTDGGADTNCKLTISNPPFNTPNWVDSFGGKGASLSYSNGQISIQSGNYTNTCYINNNNTNITNIFKGTRSNSETNNGNGQVIISYKSPPILTTSTTTTPPPTTTTTLPPTTTTPPPTTTTTLPPTTTTTSSPSPSYTCQEMSDIYGTVAGVTWGNLPDSLKNTWIINKCSTSPSCATSATLINNNIETWPNKQKLEFQRWYLNKCIYNNASS